MRGVDPGPDNDFTVIRSGMVCDPTASRIPEAGPEASMTEYRLTGSNDLPTKRPEKEFLREFTPLDAPEPEQYPTQYVTAERPKGFPWWLLLVGAVVLLS